MYFFRFKLGILFRNTSYIMSDIETTPTPQPERQRYIAIPKYKGCFEEVGHYTKQLSTGKIATLKYTTGWRWGECIVEITEKERRDIIQNDEVCLSNYDLEFSESTDGCGADYELDNKDNYTKKEMREIVESMAPGEESDEEEEEEEEVEPTICTDTDDCACEESPDAFECDDCGAKGMNCFENLGMSKDEATAYMELGQPDRCEKCFDIWKNTDDAKEYLQTIDDDDASTVSLGGCDTDFMEDEGEWSLDETYYYIYTGCVLVPEGENIEDYAQGDGSYANKKEDPVSVFDLTDA